MAARVTPLHHSLSALEPQLGPSFSPSLLIQVHEAAAVVASGGDAGDNEHPEARVSASRHAHWAESVPIRHGTPGQRRLLLVQVHLRFTNVNARPIRVRRASQVPQGRVPPGGARQGPIVGHVLQSAAPTGSSP